MCFLLSARKLRVKTKRNVHGDEAIKMGGKSSKATAPEAAAPEYKTKKAAGPAKTSITASSGENDRLHRFLEERTHAGQRIDASLFRGVSLRFFEDFVRDNSIPDEATTKEVCEQFIKPTIAADLCAYADVVARTRPDDVSPTASYFVSHAWKYRFVDVVASLRDFVKGNALDPARTFLWFDIFVVNQNPSVQADFPKDFWTTTFVDAIGAIGHTLLVLAPWGNPVPLTRAWCLWEILSSVKHEAAGCKLTICLSEHERESFVDTLANDYDKIMNLFCKIDAHKAEAWSEDDKEMIFAAIEAGPGFARVNEAVLGKMRTWLAATGAAAAEAKKAKEGATAGVAKLLNHVALLLKSQVRYKYKPFSMLWSAFLLRVVEPYYADAAK